MMSWFWILGQVWDIRQLVISLIAEFVIAVEDDSSLASEAEEILSEIGADNVVVRNWQTRRRCTGAWAL